MPHSTRRLSPRLLMRHVSGNELNYAQTCSKSTSHYSCRPESSLNTRGRGNIIGFRSKAHPHREPFDPEAEKSSVVITFHFLAFLPILHLLGRIRRTSARPLISIHHARCRRWRPGTRALSLGHLARILYKLCRLMAPTRILTDSYSFRLA